MLLTNGTRQEIIWRGKWELDQEDLNLIKTANYINECGADVLFLQHEYGLFGGFDGVFVLKFRESKDSHCFFLPYSSSYAYLKRRTFRLNILKISVI